MVDIKRQDITLENRTKGISADEFAGGSYFYSDGIQSGYSTKGFKLGPYKDTKNLNERTQGRPLAVCPCMGDLRFSDTRNFIAFTKDCSLEMGGNLNGSTDGLGDSSGGGAIFKEWQAGAACTGGFVYGDYALVFRNTSVRKIDYKNIYDIEYGEQITNPRFENSAAGWTIGSGWTLTDNGMEHEVGETGTLEVTFNITALGTMRKAIKVTNCTKGYVTLTTSLGAYTVTTEEGRNGWFVGMTSNGNTTPTETITITPTSDFDGIIEAVNSHDYDMNAIDTISGLTNADKHIAIERGGDIYIAGGNTIDVLSTIDWTISDSKQLVREDETIVALTQQADAIIIRATNGIDSRQYYWNGVDSVASEVIRWQGQVIKGAIGTEIVSYVLAGTGGQSGGQAYRLYSVNGYQRSLIASNSFKVQPASWNLEHYHPSKKFVFNDVQGPESMTVFLDNLYIPGCDGIYQFGQTLPGLSNSWSRPIRYPNDSDKLFLFQYGATIGFLYRQNQRTYYVQLDDSRYCDYGYLVTDSIYWDKIGTRKAIEKLKLGYKSTSSDVGNLKIYVIADDDYFWRFDVTGVSTRPKVGDVYEVAEDTRAEIIKINKKTSGKGEITFRTISNGGSLDRANQYLIKVSGDGDNSLSTNNNYDNMCLVKTIETDEQVYGSDLIFGKDFVNNYMPYWHKIQLVIEIEMKKGIARYGYRTPEIYELSIQSDITDVTL